MIRLQSLALFAALGYPPTPVELAIASSDGPIDPPMELVRGRIVFKGEERMVAEHEARRLFLPRKLRKARRVVRWLARLSGIRFVALCNTTSLGHARDEGDLDFFIVTRSGSIWQSRLCATLPFKILGIRPKPGMSERDAVCLSYFVDDTHLDLASHMLEHDDPYFRHWFLSLLPLYDDGVSVQLWHANTAILSRHPSAMPWIPNQDLLVKPARVTLPVFAWLERPAKWLQYKLFNTRIKQAMNKDTSVIVHDHVLKFHVDDGREKFRQAYRDICTKYGIAP
ncbi:hypothetical protein IT407_05005 [Candidatus Uhrbacteria bacterium]|nr:hypothetical protein [Candidatus Uhrbacteria bacterium]